MNEQENQPNDTNETAPTALADLEAKKAEEIKGGLTKNGGGTLILSSSNTYQGNHNLTKELTGTL